MATNQLNIPEKIKVGFQKRDGTYTGKLAYVVYFDQKGVLRKENSWEGWRSKDIEPIEYKNEPMEGFVLNKGVGGARHSYGWNPRNEYIRVYDPRDFEFEISVANLLFILRECDCSKGKGLEGAFVYAWDRADLVLLPVISQDYTSSKNFTQLQRQGVKSKELVPGRTYITKKQKILTYLGRFDFYEQNYNWHPVKYHKNVHIFHDEKGFYGLKDLKPIASLHSDIVVDNYAELVGKYNKSPHASKPVKLFLKEERDEEVGQSYYWRSPDFYKDEGNGKFGVYFLEYGRNSEGSISKEVIEYMCLSNKIYLDSHSMVKETYHNQRFAYPPGKSGKSDMKWFEPTKDRLWVEFESGGQHRYSNCLLRKESL